ncbi:MAG: histidine kinase, partial [Alphaproteobacteria bacterium]|nr:histidine kinase [Alphaproteobacteria bacterium]
MIGRTLFRTVRSRLLFAAILIETLMLTLMVGNGLRVLGNSLAEQTQVSSDQFSKVLNAALVTPMAQRDYATVQAVLDESHAVEMLKYLAVLDRRGKRIASSGLAGAEALPEP